MDDGRSGQIPTNLRLLMVLEEVARLGVPVTPTEVNATLGLPKPTIHRLFHTLEQEGFVQRDLDGRGYSPGRRMRRLSVNALSSAHVRTARLAILKALATEIGETCNIATPDRDSMVYLDRVETHWPLRIQLPIGTSVPLYCTASGKMYLTSLARTTLDRFLAATPMPPRTEATLTEPAALKSEIDKIRKQGYSTDNEEFMQGMTAIAVPILDDQNRIVSTLSVHAPVQRITLDGLKGHLGLLRAASKELSSLLIGEA